MKAKRKVVSVILSLTFAVSAFAFEPATYAANKAFKPNEVIECEDTTIAKSGVSVVKDKNSGGGKYVTSTNDIREAASIEKPDMSFDIDISEDGIYSVYAKVILAKDSVD